MPTITMPQPTRRVALSPSNQAALTMLFGVCFCSTTFVFWSLRMVHLERHVDAMDLPSRMLQTQLGWQGTAPPRQLVSATEDADNKANPAREVHFLTADVLGVNDAFSATWLQTQRDFMDMPFERMTSCEEVSHRAHDGRPDKLRMALDWMDFSVEHMSKWWKILLWDSEINSIAYQSITQHFESFLQRAPQFPMDKEEDRVFKNAIAVIAFLPYDSKFQPKRAVNLTALSLAATVESLRRAGFGRVVVSILEQKETVYLQDAFYRISSQLSPSADIQFGTVTKIAQMEVGHAMATKQYLETSFMDNNIPRATVMTLRDAFLYSEVPSQNRTVEMNQTITSWLGDAHEASYWKYVYLTEPDTLLQTRSAALPALKAAVDQGHVLVPHRFQPIPHESDVRGMNPKRGTFLLEHDFNQVLELDPASGGDACCDEMERRHKPGIEQPCATIGMPWFHCGFVHWGPESRREGDRHFRIRPYELIRIKGGTGIVTIAGSNHGRRCIPSPSGVCRPRPKKALGQQKAQRLPYQGQVQFANLRAKDLNRMTPRVSPIAAA